MASTAVPVESLHPTVCNKCVHMWNKRASINGRNEVLQREGQVTRERFPSGSSEQEVREKKFRFIPSVSTEESNFVENSFNSQLAKIFFYPVSM